MMYKKILVPVAAQRNCERAKKVLDRALEMKDAEIVILHVTPPIAQVIGGEAREKVIAESKQEALLAMTPVVEILEEKKANFHMHIEAGTVAETITTVADEENVDLIMMFTDGRDEISDLLLGSLTERVLRNTGVDLLAIRN